MSEAATEVIVRPRIGRLDSVRGWRREVGKIYKAMRCGAIPATEGTKLAFVADIGARLTRVEEQLRKFDDMARQLERLEGRAPALAPYMDYGADGTLQASTGEATS
jgi:hypothetical protein